VRAERKRAKAAKAASKTSSSSSSPSSSTNPPAPGSKPVGSSSEGKGEANSDSEDDEGAPPSATATLLARLMQTQQAMLDETSELKQLLISIKKERADDFAEQHHQRQQQQQQRGGGRATPHMLPLFVAATAAGVGGSQPSSSSSASHSSSSSAGSLSSERYAKMLETAFGDNKQMLDLGVGDGENLGKLHDPAVGGFLSSRHPQNHSSHTTNPPLLLLPSRLRHTPPSEGPSTAFELLQRFLSEETKGPLRQKRIKSWEEWMQGMREVTLQASTSGHSQLVGQSLHYIRLMSDLRDTYGWAAAEFYWYELQKEISVGFHKLEEGSPINPRVMFDLKAKFQPLAGGRQRGTGTAAPAATGAAATPGGSNPRRGFGNRAGGGGSYSNSGRAPTHQCEIHGPNFSHSSAECKVLLNKRPGGAASSSGAAPAKHT